MLKEIIRFDKFVGAEIHEREVMGEMQECISIPMALNGIHHSYNKSIILIMAVIPKRPNAKRETHFLKVEFNSKNPQLKEMKRKVDSLGFSNNLNFIGNIYFFGNSKTGFHSGPATKNKIDLDDALNNEE